MIIPKFSWLLVWVGMSCFGYAQSSIQNQLWSPSTANNLPSNLHAPQQNEYYQLNTSHFENLLKDCPVRFETTLTGQQVKITLPYPDGTLHSFRIEEAPIFGEELRQQFPRIRSFVGFGGNNRKEVARFAWSPHGLQGIIFSATYGTIFIDPLDKQHPVLYKSYFKEGQLPADFACSTLQKEEQPTQSRSANPAGDCMLRKYRLAVACTAEYTEYHGGTIADALAALNVTLTRINAIFEKEVAITFELVDNNSEIIFLDPETDPFPDIAPNGFFDDTEIFDEGERIMNERIGVENYDVGHVFITGLGGIAWTSGACMDQYKARGISGLNTPEGPLFDVDIVAHELGHQFGADHSFSGDDGACFRNTSEQHAVEPGSGTTIMSYAGLCERQNVTAQVDPYFHARNLDQIGGHVTNLRNDCATLIPIDNDIPTADAGANYTIPLATPFVLSGEGTDRNADNLTYTWEQMDNGLTIQPPRNTARNGPLFRSLPPSDRPVRYFPDLLDLVNNRTTRWEVLPATGRDLNFRFTVRDNGTLGGCTAEDDVRLTVDGRAGPFRVVEGGFVKWGIEEVQTIEWNVANTTNSNIGADQVDVFLSIDGGLTYPILLANGLPNTGFAEILVPNQPTDQARIMIKGHDHVFFDINNENFIIEPVKNGVLIELPETSQQVCVNQEAVYPIVLGISGVFTGEALLSVKGLPEGVVANFSEATLQPPGTASLTLSNFSDIAAGTYDFDLITQTDQETQERTLQLILFDAAANIVSLQSPANNTGGWINTPTFEWTSLTGDNSYVFQLASSPFFEELIIEVPLSSNSYTLPNALSLANTTRYYWRVQVISDCPSDIPEVFTFTTASIICKAYESTDLPKIISPNGESSAISIITVPDQGTLLDLNIKEVEVEHTWISDVSIGLISPEETVVALVIEPCFGAANLLLSFDDEAPNSYFSIPCPPISDDTYNPVDELSELNGEPITGDWNLILLDRYDDDGGQFQQWSMELCFLDETAIPNLSFFLTKEDASCFNSEDGKAIAMPIDGMGEYTYQWSNGDTTATTEGLSAGTYTVTVSDIDTSLVQTIEITSTDSVEAIYASKEKVCLDAQTGFITLQSDSTNLSFSWNTGATSASLANIEAGVYSVTITNQTGCTLTKEFSIAEEPALQIELTTHDVSCHGGQDGSLEIRLEQDQNLFYQWSGESSNPFDDQLSSGVYGLTITTENGCSESFELIINEPPPLTLATTIQPPNCPGDSAIVDMLPAGGIAPYQIACETPTGDCSFITDSTLLVTIIDANNCLLKEEVKIEVPSEIEVTTVVTNPTNIIAEDGSIFTRVAGGVAPYTYIWNTGDSTQHLEDLGIGTYELTIEDANGCTQITTISLETNVCYTIGLDFSLDLPDCLDEGVGAIETTPINGIAPFSFEWNTGDTIQHLTDIPIGLYELTITDARGCTGTREQFLNPESDIQIELLTTTNYSCQSDQFGSLEVEATGGVGALKYIWSNQQIGTANDSLLVGTYFVSVMDEMGCTVIQSYSIVNEDQRIRPRFVKQVRLFLDENGKETIEEFMLLETPIDSCSIAAVQFSKLTFDCDDLGENQVKVTTQYKDASMETVTVPVMVLDTLPPVFVCPQNTVINTCEESVPVTYLAVASDNCLAPILEDVSGLLSGEHFPNGTTEIVKRAFDDAGNEAICIFTVTVGQDTTLTINYTDDSILEEGIPSEDLIVLLHRLDGCDSIDFKSTIQPSGGMAPYEIVVSSEEAGDSTTLTVEVTDTNGCIVIDEISASLQSTIPQVIDSILPERNNDQNGAIFLTVTDNISPIIQYEWSFNDTLFSTEQNINGLMAGTYDLILIDDFGCAYGYEFIVERQMSVSTTETVLSNQISIAPNPSDGLFTIQLNSSDDYLRSIQVFSVEGRLLPVDSITDGRRTSTSIDLQDYPKGVYLLKVQTEKGIALRKIALF